MRNNVQPHAAEDCGGECAEHAASAPLVSRNPVNPFPHYGACGQCRNEQRCNYCGDAPVYRCTNGRCSTCHAKICTPGGITSTGHGFGQQGGKHFADT